MIDLNKYRNIIFDFDGVILDTNTLKENNIEKTIKKYLSPQKSKSCLQYFNSNPGIPREIKLKKHIQNRQILNHVLDEYNKLNIKSLVDSKFVFGVKDFLKKWESPNLKFLVLSGADQNELKFLIENKKIKRFFNYIGGGPLTKIDHLNNLKLTGKSIYFGDSKYDNFVANKFGFDFIFVNGYTSIRKVDLEFDCFKVITNFNEI